MAEAHSAVAPGTDVPWLARMLAAVHDAVLAGAALRSQPYRIDPAVAVMLTERTTL